MAVDGFNEILNTVYIAKKLHGMGKYELVTDSFFDSLDYDVYFENMCTLIPNLFEYHLIHCLCPNLQWCKAYQSNSI